MEILFFLGPNETVEVDTLFCDPMPINEVLCSKSKSKLIRKVGQNGIFFN